MKAHNDERNGRGLLNLFLIITIIGLLGIFFCRYVLNNTTPENEIADNKTIDTIAEIEEIEEIENMEDVGTHKAAHTTTQITMTSAEWNEHLQELKRLKASITTLQLEVRTLKSELHQLKTSHSKSSYSKQTVVSTKSVSNNAIGTSYSSSTRTANNVSESTDTSVSSYAYADDINNTTAEVSSTTSETFEANAVTLVNYTHDWYDDNATISIKNNTNKTIFSITGRMLYYDMKNNMLDYQDFTKDIHIEPGMTKSFELPGYGQKDHYSYYKSNTLTHLKKRTYKVEFQLQSVKYGR